MAQTELFVGFVVGVVLLAFVVAYVGRGWRQYTVSAPVGGGGSGGSSGETSSTMSNWTEDPTVLSLAFLLLALGFGLIAVLFVGGGGVSEEMTNTAGAVLVGATVLVVVAYLFHGTYHAARSWGLERSQAALLGSWVLGLLFIVALSLRLLGLL
ncbi:hypothetical protein C455_04676 [Haloferax larsenii JCM 13917]|nr:hypothetical protein [Haloferax larsenii]ELZ81458.1 hypothetical protein C455_04676 [Haloferax larsenii JCM 13917]